MDPTTEHSNRAYWTLLLSAAAILMITMGSRATTGLFVSPLNTATGLGIVKISFAMAIGQFVWGASQPIFGAIADKFGATRVIYAGGILLAGGTAMTPFVTSEWGLILTLGILTAAGAGAGSFSILIAGSAQRLPAERRAFAGGFINAGGSFGQVVFAPLVQAVISAAGWVAAMFTLAASTLLTIPIAWLMRKRGDASAKPIGAAGPVKAEIGLRQQLKIALRNPSYLYLHAGFFTCGFHIAFLITHLPGEVALCSLSPSVSASALALIGLFNIAGSLAAGMLGSRYRMKSILALTYASRGVIIIIYLLSPKTPLTFYVFAAALGFTWLATVPPTAGIVSKLFGMRYMATLFGLTLLSHQIGGFFGAWLGGVTVAQTGNYQWMWYADIVLAFFAALVNLPIREAKIAPRIQPQPV
jgi:MFS family permease